MHCGGGVIPACNGQGAVCPGRGLCLPMRGLPGEASAQGVCVQRGVHPQHRGRHFPGPMDCVERQTSPDPEAVNPPPPDMTIEAGGTHPAEMYSCVLD